RAVPLSRSENASVRLIFAAVFLSFMFSPFRYTRLTFAGNLIILIAWRMDMKRYVIKIQYNSPVVLTFALLALGALGLCILTDGDTTMRYFSVYRAPLTDPLTWLRFFPHV